MNFNSTKFYASLFSLILLTSSCASGYQQISPQLLNFISVSSSAKDVELKYKYDVLQKKYKKKENLKGIRVVALQISNNSDDELIFGENLTLKYANGNNAVIIPREKAIKELKQTTPTYLLYLLLTPLSLITTETNSNGFQEETNNIPIGLVVGPGLAFGNMIAAGGANTKFKSEMANNDLMGQKIKPGEIAIGLVALRSNSYDSLELSIAND